MSSARRRMARMTQPKAPPRRQQKRCLRHGVAVGGICSDMHRLVICDDEEDEGRMAEVSGRRVADRTA
jgi:hypothetical protein